MTKPRFVHTSTVKKTVAAITPACDLRKVDHDVGRSGLVAMPLCFRVVAIVVLAVRAVRVAMWRMWRVWLCVAVVGSRRQLLLGKRAGCGACGRLRIAACAMRMARVANVAIVVHAVRAVRMAMWRMWRVWPWRLSALTQTWLRGAIRSWCARCTWKA